MDHYKILGLSRKATKEEIKEAFRKLALKFHPDKHSDSPKAVRDGATLKFKQVSEAYEILSDDLKRADYNRRSGSFNGASGYGDGYGRSSYKPKRRPSYGNGTRGFDFDVAFRFLTGRRFLLNAALASILLGGAFVIETSGDALWKMHNSGKSFEETMESIEKIKAQKEKS